MHLSLRGGRYRVCFHVMRRLHPPVVVAGVQGEDPDLRERHVSCAGGVACMTSRSHLRSDLRNFGEKFLRDVV